MGASPHAPEVYRLSAIGRQSLPSLEHPDAVTLSLTASGAGFLGEPLTLVGRTVTSLTLDGTAPDDWFYGYGYGYGGAPTVSGLADGMFATTGWGSAADMAQYAIQIGVDSTIG